MAWLGKWLSKRKKSPIQNGLLSFDAEYRSLLSQNRFLKMKLNRYCKMKKKHLSRNFKIRKKQMSPNKKTKQIFLPASILMT